MKIFLSVIIASLLLGCAALKPLSTVLTVGEVVKGVDEAESNEPTEIKDVVHKSTIVEEDIESIPLPSPNFDSKKAVDSIPWWLFAIVFVTGLITLINSVRGFLYRRKINDSSRTDNDGRWRSDGRSVQVHGSGTEEQAKTDGNDDGRSAAESGSEERRQRVRISFRKRSGR